MSQLHTAVVAIRFLLASAGNTKHYVARTTIYSLLLSKSPPTPYAVALSLLSSLLKQSARVLP